MLRIVVGEASGGKTLVHLEGVVVGPWVAELERICAPIVARGEELHMDLSTVSFVSREGIELLSRLGAGHVRLENCSAFVAAQLRAAASESVNGNRTPCAREDQP